MHLLKQKIGYDMEATCDVGKKNKKWQNDGWPNE